MLRPRFLRVDMYPRIRQKLSAPSSPRKHPLIFCFSFTILRSRLNSAEGLLPPLVFRTVLVTFATHGSSVDRPLVTSTIPSGEFNYPTMYLVVTVTVERRQIVIPVT